MLKRKRQIEKEEEEEEGPDSPAAKRRRASGKDMHPLLEGREKQLVSNPFEVWRTFIVGPRNPRLSLKITTLPFVREVSLNGIQLLSMCTLEVTLSSRPLPRVKIGYAGLEPAALGVCSALPHKVASA